MHTSENCDYCNEIYDDDFDFDECEHPNTRTIAHRREKERSKETKLRKIINHSGYAPHIGYISVDHIIHSSNSNCQRWMKRLTSKRARKTDIPNGNSYRRVYDYWWNLY